MIKMKNFQKVTQSVSNMKQKTQIMLLKRVICEENSCILSLSRHNNPYCITFLFVMKKLILHAECILNNRKIIYQMFPHVALLPCPKNWFGSKRDMYHKRGDSMMFDPVSHLLVVLQQLDLFVVQSYLFFNFISCLTF